MDQTVTGRRDPEGVGRDADGRVVLIGAACPECGTRFFPATPVCPHCASEAVAPEAMPRTGTLYSFTTVHAGPRKWKKPMVVGYLDLPNGVRVFAHLRGQVAIDDVLELDLDTICEEDGQPIEGFVFRPAGGV